MALADLDLQGLGRPSLALSPDGTHLAYVANRGGQRQLFLRQMDAFEARLVPGTEGAFHPFFSPDGQWLAFFTPTQLRKVAIRGGTPATLCAVTSPGGASWGIDNTIVISDVDGTRLSRVSADGGDLEVILQRRASEGEYLRWPQILPDGRHLIVSVWTLFARRIEVVSLESGERRVLIERGEAAQYVASGHLVYSGEGGVLAVPFDLEQLVVSGSAFPVLDDVRREGSYSGVAQMVFSDDGLLAYIPGDDMSVSTPVWVDRSGRQVDAASLPAQRYWSFTLSPDGSSLAIQIDSTTSDVWVHDFGRVGSLTKLTLEGNNGFPFWTLDGRRVTFLSDNPGPGRPAPGGIYWQAIDGGAAEWLMGDWEGGVNAGYAWLRDGALAYEKITTEGSDLLTWSSETGESQPLVVTPYNEFLPSFSPDGDWFVYSSDRSGQLEVYVKKYPPTEESWLVSTASGQRPIWSPAGHELFYRRGREFWSVEVDTTEGFTHGPPRMLFEGPYVDVGGRSFAVAPDGARFLVLKEREQPPPRSIHLVENWFEELTRLVPTN